MFNCICAVLRGSLLCSCGLSTLLWNKGVIIIIIIIIIIITKLCQTVGGKSAKLPQHAWSCPFRKTGGPKLYIFGQRLQDVAGKYLRNKSSYTKPGMALETANGRLLYSFPEFRQLLLVHNRRKTGPEFLLTSVNSAFCFIVRFGIRRSVNGPQPNFANCANKCCKILESSV